MVAASPVLPVVFFWLFGLGGMGGLPLGVPPLPEDPVLSKAAPDECLFYAMSAGVGAADAKSENQTEQLIAEPEVARLATTIQKAIIAAVRKDASRKSPQDAAMADDAIYAAKTLLTRPMAVYLADLKIQPGSMPEVHAGAILNAGEDAAKLKTLIERYQKQVIPDATEVTIGGKTFEQVFLPGGPEVTWGVANKHLLFAVGPDEMKSLLERAKSEPPKWLTSLKKEMPVERLSTLVRVDVKTILDKFGPLGGPQFAAVMETTGFNAITQLAAVSGLDKEGCVNHTQVAIDGEPQGLLALVDQSPLAAKDLTVIPRDATFAAAASFDAAKAMESILAVVEKLSPRDAQQFREGLARAEQETGVNLETDILKPLGTTWRIFDSPSGGGMFTGVTAVLSVRDAKQLEDAQTKLLELAEAALQNSPRADRGPKIERVTVGENEIYVFNPRERDVLIAPSWCIVGDQLVVGLYPQAVKAYLARSPKTASIDKVPAVAGAIAGEETIKFLYMDTQKVFDLVYPVLPVLAQAATTELQREGIDLSVELLPTAGAIRPHLKPSIICVKRTKAGLEIISRQTIPSGGVLSSVPMAAAIALPAVGSARGAARRAQSMNNLKQIALAMFNYETAHNAFPAAYTADKDGKPLLSWRVAILPYIEEDALYKQFKLDEPWDSENNKKLIEKMPQIYRSATSSAAPGMTTYLTIRGDNTAFPGVKGTKPADITDGLSNTIMAVEVSDANAVPWTKPDDFEPDAENPFKGLLGQQQGGFLAAFCDGSVRLISFSTAPEILKNLFDRDDGKAVDQSGF